MSSNSCEYRDAFLAGLFCRTTAHDDADHDGGGKHGDIEPPPVLPECQPVSGWPTLADMESLLATDSEAFKFDQLGAPNSGDHWGDLDVPSATWIAYCNPPTLPEHPSASGPVTLPIGGMSGIGAVNALAPKPATVTLAGAPTQAPSRVYFPHPLLGTGAGGHNAPGPAVPSSSTSGASGGSSMQPGQPKVPRAVPAQAPTQPSSRQLLAQAPKTAQVTSMGELADR